MKANNFFRRQKNILLSALRDCKNSRFKIMSTVILISALIFIPIFLNYIDDIFDSFLNNEVETNKLLAIVAKDVSIKSTIKNLEKLNQIDNINIVDLNQDYKIFIDNNFNDINITQTIKMPEALEITIKSTVELSGLRFLQKSLSEFKDLTYNKDDLDTIIELFKLKGFLSISIHIIIFLSYSATIIILFNLVNSFFTQNKKYISLGKLLGATNKYLVNTFIYHALIISFSIGISLQIIFYLIDTRFILPFLNYIEYTSIYDKAQGYELIIKSTLFTYIISLLAIYISVKRIKIDNNNI